MSKPFATGYIMESVKPKIKEVRNPVVEYSGPYKTSAEYTSALRSWIFQLYQVQCIHSSFPLFLANLHAQSASSNPGLLQQPQNISGASVNENRQQEQNVGSRNDETNAQMQGEEFTIPPIWKRFVAEGIDFFLFFLIKLFATYLVIDSLELLEDLDKYNLDELTVDLTSTYKLAFSLSSELIFLELLHRVGTCLLEAICLQRSFGIFGGATPGKSLMGLKVVRFGHATPVLDSRIIVYPATHLGFPRALLRSVVKNITMTFLLPIFITMFAFQYNRTIYDVVSGSIVVEVNYRRRPAH